MVHDTTVELLEAFRIMTFQRTGLSWSELAPADAPGLQTLWKLCLSNLQT